VKKYSYSLNANINFTVRRITNVNANANTASRKLLYTGVWIKWNVQISKRPKRSVFSQWKSAPVS